MYQEDKTKWSYLAALIDGEGCISIYRRLSDGEKYTRTRKVKANTNPYNQFSLRISIANTNLKIMKWLIANFGGVYYQKREATDKHKAGYEWRPKGRANVEKLLLGILPYMVIKDEQAKVGLEYLRMSNEGERNPGKREELYLQAKALNQKGKCVTTNTPDELCPNNGQDSIIESELDSDVESEDRVTDLGTEELDYFDPESFQKKLENVVKQHKEDLDFKAQAFFDLMSSVQNTIT
jgi:hypothetical protein